MTNDKEGFCGEFEFLSNFSPSPVEYKGHIYPSIEVAFQSAKCYNEVDAGLFKKFKTHFDSGKAKRLGRQINLRPDWENIKLDIMFDLLCKKFQIPSLRQQLLTTGDMEITEFNQWHDITFGVCTCNRCSKKEAKNILGKMLMEIRDLINKGEL
jgi:ribA/ribD-fused uncharacterized protein